MYNAGMTTACALVRSPGHVFPGHEEAPSRFRFFGDWDAKPYRVTFLDPEPAPRETVTAVHSERMLRFFEEACRQGPGITDYAPTYVTQTTFADAFLAAGATLACTQEVLAGRARNAFAIVRPPGHHAEPEAAMGFCLLNNVAIAARFALANGIQKLLIFDFDAHHGNGTQAVFWDEPGVAYFSTHQENIYPFRTGFMDEAPHARSRIVNLPLPARAGDAAFARIADEALTPLVETFKPEMILVSAGFDSHWSDPLAELGLSSAGYFALAQTLVTLADAFCGGKLVFALEGGYNPVNVASGVDATLCALTGTDFSPQDPSPYEEPEVAEQMKRLREWHGWK
jgi:acetoin utilization deacetylase AcuC-like enzyme